MTGSTELPYGIPPPAYRLPDGTHVGAVHLLVSDLSRSMAYYEQVIGLRAHSVTDDSAILRPRDDDRTLVTLQTRPGVTRARRGAFGLFHFAILLPDLAHLGQFATHVASLEIEAGMADHLVSRSFYLTDPDGLGIEVYADRSPDTWRHHGRELAMTTDPLDVRAVIAAAGGKPWAGAPPGTTMGHVHLHVGSLVTAEAFYHRALGLDKTVWNYPGALFMAASGYHHHLGTNIWSPGPAPSADQARLLEWELVLPSDADVAEAARSIRAAGHNVETSPNGLSAADAWGTRVRLRTALEDAAD